jgi:hypothetical protein
MANKTGKGGFKKGPIGQSDYPPLPEATTNRPRNSARRMVALGTLKPSHVQTNIEEPLAVGAVSGWFALSPNSAIVSRPIAANNVISRWSKSIIGANV